MSGILTFKNGGKIFFKKYDTSNEKYKGSGIDLIWMPDEEENKMNITKITISRGATINLGNYESARVDCSLEATTPDQRGESMEEIRAELNIYNNEFLNQEVQKIEQANGLPPRGAGRFTGSS